MCSTLCTAYLLIEDYTEDSEERIQWIQIFETTQNRKSERKKEPLQQVGPPTALGGSHVVTHYSFLVVEGTRFVWQHDEGRVGLLVTLAYSMTLRCTAAVSRLRRGGDLAQVQGKCG